jgi:excisionase family DNA binding protein
MAMKEQTDISNYCTVEEAAELLRVKEATVRGYYLPLNKIESKKFGNSRMLSRAGIKQWIADRKKKGWKRYEN